MVAAGGGLLLEQLLTDEKDDPPGSSFLLLFANYGGPSRLNRAWKGPPLALVVVAPRPCHDVPRPQNPLEGQLK